MIRRVDLERDIADITRIYGWYVSNTTVTFEVVPLSETAMKERVDGIASAFPCFVWEENGQVAGYCYAHRWKSFPAYDVTLETTIYLDPEVKGMGIGFKLMKHLIEECRHQGFVSLIACITAENEESCRFHEKLGFEKVSRFRRVGKKFGRLLDVVDYQYII